jgi:crossover junction endodeoxyribonuclease RuvC
VTARRAKSLLREVDGGLLSTPEEGVAVFVGIDQSLTGFAVTAYAPSGKYHSWVYTSPLRGVKRLRDLEEFLGDRVTQITKTYTIQDFAMEDGVYASQNALPMGEIAATVKLYLARLGVYPLRVPPTVVKKYATSRGNAKKNEVLLAVYKNWGAEFTDDNLADSFVIAKVCSAVNGKETTTFTHQKSVVALINSTPDKFRDS